MGLGTRDLGDDFWLDIKLFFTFLLVFMVFANWMGPNETTRLDLSRSIVEEGDLDIDEFANNTGDHIFYEGHFYADKPPVTSYIGVPVYLIGKNVFPTSYEEMDVTWMEGAKDFTGEYNYYPAVLPAFLAMSRFLFVLVTAALPGALLVVVIRRSVATYYDERIALMTAVSLGAGTLLFHYSTIAMGTMLGSLFVFSSFYFVAVADRPWLAGLLAGLAATTVYYAVPIAALLLGLLVYWRRWEGGGWFVVGGLVGILPALLYYVAVDGFGFVSFIRATVFTYPPGSDTVPLAGGASSLLGTIVIPVSIGLKLLFYPVRGLFFYSPVLLVSLLPLVDRERLGEVRIWFPLVVLASMLVFNANLLNWFAGGSYGPRYMIPVIPFLAFPFAAGIAVLKDWADYVVAVLVPVGVFQSLLATQYPLNRHLDPLQGWREIDPGHIGYFFTGSFDGGTVVRAFKPASLGNYVEHLSYFFGGHEFYLFETFLPGFGVGWLQYPQRVVLGSIGDWLVFYRLRFLVIPAVLVAVYLVWFSDVSEQVADWSPVGCAFIGGLLVAFMLPLQVVSFDGVAYTSGFHAEEEVDGETFRWMRDAGEVVVRGSGDTVVVEFASSYDQGRNVSVLVDGERRGVVRVPSHGATSSIKLDDAGPGVRRLNMVSFPTCRFSSHGRCLSVAVRDVAVR